MKVTSEQSVKIRVSGDDAKHLKSAFKTLALKVQAVGFGATPLSKEESEVIVKLSKELNK